MIAKRKIKNQKEVTEEAKAHLLQKSKKQLQEEVIRLVPHLSLVESASSLIQAVEI